MYVYVHSAYPNGFNEFIANMGWTLAPTLLDAQIVIFTGGADVNPKIYNEPRHYTTNYNDLRDATDADMYAYCVENNKYMVGICRGGQFLNVMSGGNMIQDVAGHAVGGTHKTHLVDSGGELLTAYGFEVTSTHHQMMVPGPGALLYAAAQGIGHKFAKKLKPTRNGIACSWTYTDDVQEIIGTSLEPECISYPEPGILCFQPHPEYDPEGDTTDLFKDCWERFLDDQEGI